MTENTLLTLISLSHILNYRLVVDIASRRLSSLIAASRLVAWIDLVP